MPSMDSQLALLLFGFVVLPLCCVACERLWPSLPDQATFRRGFASDLVWYVAQTYVSRAIAPWVVYFVLVALLPSAQTRTEAYFAGFGPASRIPLGWQVPIVFVAADFLSYWQHRFFHARGLWRIHVVHHSSEDLDWLSSTRFHPLNEIGAQLVYVTPLLLLGFSPIAFLVLVPFTASYAVFLHANVDWSFGSFRYLVASPVFHRWHHTLGSQGRDRNFSGFLPVWDLLFGTFFMPAGRTPESFGVDEAVPEGFLRQMAYPFARDRVA